MEERIEALCAVVELMVEKLEALDGRMAKLESTVMDDIIGGVTKLYNENLRMENIEGLKGKYGELFGDMNETFGELYDADLWEKLQDLLDELREESGDEYNDEMGDAKIREIATQLAAKIAKVKGEEAEPEAEVTVVAEGEAEPEAPGEEEAPAEEETGDEMNPIVESIKKMKSRGKVPGIVGDVA